MIDRDSSADVGALASSSPDAHADGIPTGMATVPSVDAQIQMPDPAHSEVNPSTITPAVQPPVGSIHACRDALVDCVNAAVRASRYDSANDNSRFLDIENCKAAASVCDTLSWIIEDLPVGERGGVIFPHRGVVLIDKGQLDRYLPPLTSKDFPPIRRSSI